MHAVDKSFTLRVGAYNNRRFESLNAGRVYTARLKRTCRCTEGAANVAASLTLQVKFLQCNIFQFTYVSVRVTIGAISTGIQQKKWSNF
jgi:hypothetical protein